LAAYLEWELQGSAEAVEASVKATMMRRRVGPSPPAISWTNCAASMIFRVDTTIIAEQDVQAILEWLLSEKAGDTVMRWFLALQERHRISCRISYTLPVCS
jgi:hypothetical protein